jgi:curli biogenesis system outer membrane secretion channel CsgG
MMSAAFSVSRLRALSLLLALFWIPVGAGVAGVKKVVAVQSFDNKAGSSQWTTGRYVDLGDAMADQLTDALIQSGQFVVLERIGLHAVVAEQDLARSGRFQQSKSARTGKLTSAQVLVQGVISEIEHSANKGGGSFSFGGIRLKNESQEVQLGLIVRLVDTTTGQVIDSQRVEARAAQGGVRALRVDDLPGRSVDQADDQAQLHFLALVLQSNAAKAKRAAALVRRVLDLADHALHENLRTGQLARTSRL